AAAAVAAVLAATLTLTSGPARPGHRTWSDALLASAPRYYVALTNTRHNRSWPRQAEVVATRTGRTVATLAAPRPGNAFIMVAAASGVGRYVLAAAPMALEHQKVVGPTGRPLPGKSVGVFEPAGPIRFYQLRISSSGQVSALSPLPVPALPAGATLDGLALTPDGRELAVATRAGGPRPGPEIQVDTLATGAQRVWTWPGAQPVEESQGGIGSALSWAVDDRTLAFSRSIDDGRYQVRLLDTMAPGSSLAAASRPALTLDWSGMSISRRFSHGRAVNNTDTFGALLTPDGSKIVVATVTQSRHPLTSEFAFTEFSARTGQVVTVLGRWRFIRRWPQQQQAVLWTNADGSTLIVLAHRPGVTVSPTSPGPGAVPQEFGVLQGNRYAPLPGQRRLGQLSTFPAW
ncbi:MAG: hypothetical protein ACRDPD_14240, partial [Streptosporangiaceae bacterium]